LHPILLALQKSPQSWQKMRMTLIPSRLHEAFSRVSSSLAWPRVPSNFSTSRSADHSILNAFGRQAETPAVDDPKKVPDLVKKKPKIRNNTVDGVEITMEHGGNPGVIILFQMMFDIRDGWLLSCIFSDFFKIPVQNLFVPDLPDTKSCLHRFYEICPCKA